MENINSLLIKKNYYTTRTYKTSGAKPL